MNRDQLVRRIEKLHPQLIVAQDNYRCVTCGSLSQPTCSHIFTRAFKSTRWDIEPDGNCHCQCWSCNFRHGGTGRRGPSDKYPYFKWYIGKFGMDKLNELHRRHNTQKKWRVTELQELRDEIVRRLKALGWEE